MSDILILGGQKVEKFKKTKWVMFCGTPCTLKDTNKQDHKHKQKSIRYDWIHCISSGPHVQDQEYLRDQLLVLLLLLYLTHCHRPVHHHSSSNQSSDNCKKGTNIYHLKKKVLKTYSRPIYSPWSWCSSPLPWPPPSLSSPSMKWI